MIPPRIKSVKAFQDYHLEIEYVNGEKKRYNMESQLQHLYFKELKNVSYFMLVKSVDITVEWPNGEDIDPNELYLNSVDIL